MPFTAASLLRRLSRLHPLLFDGAVALALTVGTWLWDWYGPDMGRPADPRAMMLTAAVNGPLALRRRAPLAVLMTAAAASFTYHHLGYHVGLNTVGLLLMLFTIAVHSPLSANAAGAVITVAVWTHASALQPDVVLGSALGSAVLLAACALAAGVVVRLLVERTRQLAVLTRRLREEQEAATQRAVTRERVRIARELHDIVAHHMSVISVQAGLGRFVAATDPATAQAALGVIEETSHEALNELRRLLSILRIEANDEDGPLYTTAPGLRNVHALAERMRGAGLPVEVGVEGRARPLPPGLDLCAFRIVQESLTNVLKHAGPVRTEVRLTYTATSLTVRVTDHGPGAGAEPSGGHGLIGMTERVRLYRGTITTRRPPHGGFEVLATLPLPPADEVE
ncbi:sensor histidine kinase [Nonomuraea candida]|uniref:sensor histidine kinase n=1 Tax=Nonomuraea candida TaxID=359159 RepID=UPI000693AD05|nr:sensor histidine kinase [Nonomuraea candida]